MYRLLFVFATLLAAAYGQTNVSQCMRNAGELPTSVKLGDCTTPPCGLRQLQDVVLDMDFIAPRNISVMTSLATAYVAIIAIPYDLGKDALTCDSLNGSNCPVIKGQHLHYTLKLFIQSFFPVGITATIEFSIVDQNLKPVTCLRVPVIVEPPAPEHTPSDSDAKVDVSQIAPVASIAPPVAVAMAGPVTQVPIVTPVAKAKLDGVAPTVASTTPVAHDN